MGIEDEGVSALEALRASFVRDLHLPREIRSVRGDLHVVVEVSGSLFGISAFQCRAHHVTASAYLAIVRRCMAWWISDRALGSFSAIRSGFYCSVRHRDSAGYSLGSSSVWSTSPWSVRWSTSAWLRPWEDARSHCSISINC
jgi:hypothetical protein